MGGFVYLVFMDETKHYLKGTQLMPRTIFEHTRKKKRYSNMCSSINFDYDRRICLTLINIFNQKKNVKVHL